MSSSSAWLLECSDALTIAVSDHEIVECVQPRLYYKIPGTPDYCCNVFAWQDKLVPVMDMAGALYGDHKAQSEPLFACLLSYQLAPRQPLQYLALRINQTPQKIQVDDEQVCEESADEDSRLLASVSFCSFLHQQLPVAILDIAKLCSEEFRDLAQAS